MGCIIIAALLGMPRIAILVLVMHGWLSRAFEHGLWPMIGFFLAPWTILAYALAMNNIGPAGQVTTAGWALTALAFAVDMGLVGGGARARRKRK